MSAQAVLKFIALLEVFFPRPKFGGAADSETIWLRSLQEDLQGYDESVLLEAAQHFRRNRNPQKDGKFFPLPAEITAVCDDIERRKAVAALPLLPGPKADEWSDERQNLAFDLCKSELGRRAAREGWVAALYHFARKNQRLPSDREIPGLLETARAVEAVASTWEPDGQVGSALVKFGRSFLTKRQGLADAVLSGKDRFSYVDGQ